MSEGTSVTGANPQPTRAAIRAMSRPLVVWDPRMLGYDLGGDHPLHPLTSCARSVNVDPAVDAEYARKYRGSASAIAHINGPGGRATTMRVDPR